MPTRSPKKRKRKEKIFIKQLIFVHILTWETCDKTTDWTRQASAIFRLQDSEVIRAVLQNLDALKKTYGKTQNKNRAHFKTRCLTARVNTLFKSIGFHIKMFKLSFTQRDTDCILTVYIKTRTWIFFWHCRCSVCPTVSISALENLNFALVVNQFLSVCESNCMGCFFKYIF